MYQSGFDDQANKTGVIIALKGMSVNLNL